MFRAMFSKGKRVLGFARKRLFFKLEIGTEAVNGNEDEADNWEPEAVSNAEVIYEFALQERKNSTSNDCHDKEGRADFSFFNRHASESDPVNRREHERHTTRDTDEAGEACGFIKEDDAHE